jgi:hypothetical protein
MAKQDIDMKVVALADDRYFEQLTRFKELRIRLGIRVGLTLIALVVGVFFIWNCWDGMLYYFSEAPVIPLGNLRAKTFDPSVVDSLRTNDRVSYSNDVIMYDELQSGNHYLYFSPVTKFVVRTTKPLPAKPVSTDPGKAIELDGLTAFEWDLVNRKLALPWDVKVSFDGEGRIVGYDDLPIWAPKLFEFMSNSSGIPREQMRLLLEGEEPGGYQANLYVVILVGVILLIMGASLVRAFLSFLGERRKLDELMHAARHGGTGAQKNKP